MAFSDSAEDDQDSFETFEEFRSFSVQRPAKRHKDLQSLCGMMAFGTVDQ